MKKNNSLQQLMSYAVLAFAAIVLLLAVTNTARTDNPADPWTAAQTVQPADFVKEIGDAKSAPTIVFVGFQRLYTAGHIHGAQYHGTGNTAEGLNQLKTWASSLPRSTNIVIYCGCCPIDHCPNLRPAFTALRDLGFTKVRALILPTSFAVDWAEKGYPYERPSER